MATDKLHLTRLMMAITLLPLLSSCAFIHKRTTQPAPITGAATAQFAAGTDDVKAKTYADKSANIDEIPAAEVAEIFPAAQEITPVGSVNKDQLSISYNLQPIQGKHEKLLRLTLIFKNLADKNRHIWPHVYLRDARGKAVRAYTLKTLLHVLSHPAASEWADMYWLKRSYRIPSHGIAIGELVYHGRQFSFPMKLSVRIDKTYYRFTAAQP